MSDRMLDMSRISAFLTWYKRLQASQKTGFMIAALSLIVFPVALLVHSQSVENRSKAAHEQECYVTGCTKQHCLPQGTPEVNLSCEYHADYVCLKLSRCEVQTSGSCGWTHTPAYDDCVKQVNKPSTKTKPKSK